MKGFATSSDGISICYEEHGDGDPSLVFVHGWSCDRSYWKKQLDHFSKEHRVVALDLAGHGESESGRKDWTMPAFSDDVDSVVKQLGLREVVLIGHSMGGDVIVEAALRAPERVRGLVWVDTWRTLGKPMTNEELQEFAAPFRADFPRTVRKFVRKMFNPGSDKELVDFVVNDMSSAPPAVALSALEHNVIFDREIVKQLPKLKAPLVEINADYRPTNVQVLEKHGVKKVVIIQNTAHFLFMEDADEFNRVLDKIICEF